ncbi:malonyl-ACP O-methyltransferase BioC [Paenibacillus caseinilyticus]|uniref:Malonyl-[acyl-carrier protein] O-methyltransferase n=1 Tax=Paenibacillus mucilaginosus K02 TaxID=997761 RepID=I0BB69_9BACL|nr:malonyl-ACP O-methyltransferase BioC [Paenibacillus mucilaginosus]AFH59616.1 biotin biosynthesis protein BioC [Paenibacillus mucilaginosus K02]
MNTWSIDKKRVRRHFDRHAHEYDLYAEVQRRMTDELMSRLLERRRGPHVGRIVEIGCGTGQLTQKLLQAYPEAEVTAIDLSPKMAEVTRLRCAPWAGERLTVLAADAETLLMSPFCTPDRFSGFDLVVSSAAFQWFTDTQKTLTSWLGRIRQEGLLAFATFGPETFRELHGAFRQAEIRLGIPHQASGQQFADREEWQRLLLPCGESAWELDWDEERVIQRFDNVWSFLDSVKRVGAGNSVQDGRAGFSMARKRIELMTEAYSRAYGREGIPATYHIYYGMFGKR